MLPRSRAIYPSEHASCIKHGMNAVIHAMRPLPEAGGWQAELKLEFAQSHQRTVLVRRSHHGPLVVQKTLYPEGGDLCHAVVVHPPGGIAGGDELTLQAYLKNGAKALLTTPGAGKWYKAAGRPASQQLNFTLQAGSVLEWLPQENILFNGARTLMLADISLAGDAAFAGWEILCLGRQARGEQWSDGSLRQIQQIRRDGRLIWMEQNVLAPEMAARHATAGWRGEPVNGTFIVAAGAVPAQVLEECRGVVTANSGLHGVTVLPEVFVARYLGQSSEEARHYFEALWQILRPWYLKRTATRPRIWNT